MQGVSAVTWPMMKIGSDSLSPLWFAALRHLRENVD